MAELVLTPENSNLKELITSHINGLIDLYRAGNYLEIIAEEKQAFFQTSATQFVDVADGFIELREINIRENPHFFRVMIENDSQDKIFVEADILAKYAWRTIDQNRIGIEFPVAAKDSSIPPQLQRELALLRLEEWFHVLQMCEKDKLISNGCKAHWQVLGIDSNDPTNVLEEIDIACAFLEIGLDISGTRWIQRYDRGKYLEILSNI